MEMVICVVIATVAALAIIDSFFRSAVETVRKNTEQQLGEIKDLFVRDQDAMMERLTKLADALGCSTESRDPLLHDVAKWGVECSCLSISAVQRSFSVSFKRAASIVNQLYEMGVCSQFGRQILITSSYEVDMMFLNLNTEE